MTPEEPDVADESRLRFLAAAVQAGFCGRVLFKLDAHLDALGSEASFELPPVEYWLLCGTPSHEYPDGLDRLRVNSRRPLAWYRREAPTTFIAEWPDGHDEYRISSSDDERFLAVRFDTPYEETRVLPTSFDVVDVHVPTEAAVDFPEGLLAAVDASNLSAASTSEETDGGTTDGTGRTDE